MGDTMHLERRLALAEELLNIVDAMRPDLPAAELYDFALQMLSSVGEYSAGSLWAYAETVYRSAAWLGLDRQRAALTKGAVLGEAKFQQFLSQLETHSGMHWALGRCRRARRSRSCRRSVRDTRCSSRWLI
jgi:hypothetical protein